MIGAWRTERVEVKEKGIADITPDADLAFWTACHSLRCTRVGRCWDELGFGEGEMLDIVGFEPCVPQSCQCV
jgi:hypothetical protein